MNGNVTLDMVYQKLQVIERELQEISADVHRVKPTYEDKLKRLEKDKVHKFSSIEDMEKNMDETDS